MGWNLNSTSDEEYPQLNAYKGAFETLLSLRTKYSEGKSGWFALITGEGSAIAYWDIISKTWEFISARYFENIDPNELKDGDSYIWDSEKKLFTIVSLSVWGTEEF